MQDVMASSLMQNIVVPVLLMGLLTVNFLTLERWRMFLEQRKRELFGTESDAKVYLGLLVHPESAQDSEENRLYWESYVAATNRLGLLFMMDWLAIFVLTSL